MNAWVYILRCSDGSYYVGSARGDLGRRFAEHQSGAFGGYTAARLPVVLVYSESFVRIETPSRPSGRSKAGRGRRRRR